MDAFYIDRAVGSSRPWSIRRAPQPLAAFPHRGSLPPALERRVAPWVRTLAQAGFQPPQTTVAENPLAMEPEVTLLLRHHSGYSAAVLTFRWGNPPELHFLSHFQRRIGVERLITSSPRLSRSALPPGTHRSPYAWPWPASDPLGLWELHQRAVALHRPGLPLPLPEGIALARHADTFRLELHQQLIASRAYRSLRGTALHAAQRRMQLARDYACRVEAMGAPDALLFTQLHERLQRKRLPLRAAGPPLLFLIAAAMVLLGGDPSLFLWAAGGSALYLSVRIALHLLTLRRGSPRAAPVVTALSGPLALGLASGILPGEAPALLYSLAALTLLLPLPGLDGGTIVTHLLYHRAPWLKPCLHLLAGAALAAWGWQQDALFLVWIGGLLALSPLLDPSYTRPLRALRQQIDWSQGATPEAISALLRASPRLTIDRLHSLYCAIQSRPLRWKASGIALILYLLALLIPLQSPIRWLMQAPVLDQITLAIAP